MMTKESFVSIIVVLIIVGFGINVVINLPSSAKEKVLFPGILGDTVLKNNETGKQVIENMTSYDGFAGNIIQGYKATYSGGNGTVIIFLAQMPDSTVANASFKDMVTRAGYDGSIATNESMINKTVIRLPVENPQVFAMRKNTNMVWHYTFTKADKVYWIGFSSTDVDYLADMLIEIYRSVDEENNNFNI